MIKFDEVDFSERRSEEVISFFWRSVYMDVDVYHCVGVIITSISLIIIVWVRCNCRMLDKVISLNMFPLSVWGCALHHSDMNRSHLEFKKTAAVIIV